jgi:hypothetical protein
MSAAKRVSASVYTASFVCAPILCALTIAGGAAAQTAPDPSLSAPANTAPAVAGVVAQPQSAAAQDDAIDAQIAAWSNGSSQTGPGQGGPGQGGPGQGAPTQLGLGQADDAAPPRQIHGEAGAAFGNHGYRSGYVTADIPIGQTSDLGVGVSDSQYQFRHGGAVNNKSLFISLSLGTGSAAATAGCRSQTIPTDGRYLEPMWEAQAHGEALARDQQGCAPLPNNAR